MKILSSLIVAFGLIFTLNAQTAKLNTFFDEADAFFKSQVSGDAITYASIKQNPTTLNALVDQVASMSLKGADANTIQAFYINAYNILVIKGAINNYPLNSVLDVPGFFDGIKYKIAGQTLTLNQLEKTNLLKTYKDPRFHFVLVCGAVDCPPIANFAYVPAKLESQLASRTRRALNNPNFVKVGSDKVQISQIFEWYSNEFGGSKKAALEFINKYRSNKIQTNSIEFYNYDWSLNEKKNSTGSIEVTKGNNASRYVVSAAIPVGTTETKIFNNLYSQSTATGENMNLRSTFFTSIFSFLYGVNSRFNAGFDLRYRRVANQTSTSSNPLHVFGGQNLDSGRSGVTTIGPKIRWAPLRELPNFSIQSAFWIPLGNDYEGTSDLPFIDWNGATWWTQFFNDFSIGDNFSLFTEIDFLLEDIGNKENGAINRLSTPATVIFSYFPNPKTTLYLLTGYSPFWQEDFDYFAQAGIGTKYQFTPKFELELLYTGFTNEFLQEVNGSAATYNIGIRINR